MSPPPDTGSGPDSRPQVEDNRAGERYEVKVGGNVAGFVTYKALGDRVVFRHTEISPAYEGQGLGGILARQALDDVRASGRMVVPLCPFIASWIERHPDYADLVTAEA